MKKNILFVCPYRSPARPTFCTFTAEEAHGLAREGAHVIVLAGCLWTNIFKRKLYPYHLIEARYPSGGMVEVYRPIRLTFPSRFAFVIPGVLNLHRVKAWLSYFAMRRFVRKMNLTVDAALAEFLYESGWKASMLAKELGVKTYVEIGEGKLATANNLHTKAQLNEFLPNIAHFICNGSHLARILENQLNVSKNRISVLANGIDLTLFAKHDKIEARKRLNLPLDKFIVSCVGHYYYEKGPNRVGEAIDGLKDVGGLFCGYGNLPPKCDNALYMGAVNHDELPWYLSASDLFVLPTLVEGCSNATQEAICCGVPILVSNNEQVADLVSPEYAETVDPLDVRAIREKIIQLKNDPDRRAAMSNAALKKRGDFEMQLRCREVLKIMFGENQ